ncbi:hypothetical protein SBOR_5909 [Sclerotinia borealis F-4128]|uniref:Transcription factor TFIIIB component B'' Myb domain-containing protein n=1 Tax=Sclerotinia borealis (strain F-4128) TaxID=1432307 RepID=W9CG38_SCLBF|nr:hypothetical protein SBOR_5909 [Sclerotinia borealis F-4128]
MSSMLRKGGKSFKPSARPRPNATRPSQSQPATRPGSDIQSQTTVSATQLSNSTPTFTENIAEKETSQSIQVTPQSKPTPQAQPQTPLSTANNDNTPAIETTAKRKVGADEVETTAQLEHPPSKARKLTPPSDQVHHFEKSASSETVPAASASASAAPDQPSRSTQQTSSQTEAASASLNTQGSIQPSPIGQDQVTDKELPSSSSSTTGNATNRKPVPAKPTQLTSNSTSTLPTGASQITTTIDNAQNDSPSTNVEIAGENGQTRNLEPERNSQNTLLGAVGAPTGPGQLVDMSIQTTPASSEDADLSGMGAGEASQTSHLVSTATPTLEETPTPIGEEAAPAAKKPRKKAAPRKKKVQVENGEEPRTEVEIQLNRPRQTPGNTRERRKKDGAVAKKRKDREGTPEDAENEVIEPAVMKMADLCKDIRIGKKFSKHDELKLRHARKKIDAQLAERPELAGLINNAPVEGNAESRAEPAEEPVIIMNNNGLQMRVIDGQIVLDDRSLQVDRHRQARDEGLVLEEIEENEFTRAVNSGQYMKRAPAVRWDSNANELFYQGLRQFGTAFEMIAAMFPDRNRRQIKLKFVREERQNPAKVDRALKGKTEEIDFEEYTQLTGQKFEDSADIQAEHQRLEDEHNAEEEKVEAAKAAADKRKKEAISKAARRGQGATSDGEDGPESQKENAGATLAGMGKKKPAKSKKSNKASMLGGGEELEILGTVQ